MEAAKEVYCPTTKCRVRTARCNIERTAPSDGGAASVVVAAAGDGDVPRRGQRTDQRAVCASEYVGSAQRERLGIGADPIHASSTYTQGGCGVGRSRNPAQLEIPVADGSHIQRGALGGRKEEQPGGVR